YCLLLLMIQLPPRSLLFPYTTLFRSLNNDVLDKDLEDTNFKESDFYTSGNFDSQFSFTIEDVQLKTIVNPTDPSDTLCVPTYTRSEEHTSELQSRENLVCRLLLEKKN